nr:hypothetical protein [Candidatus Levybacteria bacterium]
MAKKVLRKTLTPTEDVNLPSSQKINLPTISINLNSLKKIKTNQILVTLLIVAAFLIGVLVTKVQYLEKSQGTAAVPSAQAPAQGNQPPAPQPGQKVDVKTGKLPVLGKSDAKVTIVEFADFR